MCTRFPTPPTRWRITAVLPAASGSTRFCATHARRFDIAHLHACRNLPVSIAARQLRAAGVPYVLAPNGTAPRLERRRAAKWIFDRDRRTRRPAAMRRPCWRSASPSGHNSRAGRARRSRIRVIPNPVDLDEFAAAARASAASAQRMRLGERSGRALSRQDHAAQAGRRARPRVRAAATGRTPPGRSPATTWARWRRSTREVACAPGSTARTTFTGLLRGARASRSAGRRRRRRLSVVGRGLRARAARGAARRHAGRRRRRFGLRRDRRATPAAASSCRSATLRR